MPENLTVKQAATYLGVSQAYIRMLVRTKRLTPVAVPIHEGAHVMRYVFGVDDLEAFKTRKSAHFGPRVDKRHRCIIHLRNDEYTQLQEYLKLNMPEVELTTTGKWGTNDQD